MDIYNEDKTQKLDESDIDLEKGYLIDEEYLIHHDGIEAVEEQGHYETINTYYNEDGSKKGKDVKWVIDVEKIEGKDPYDEVAIRQIYIPYTEEQVKQIARDKLREIRQKRCFNVIDRPAWFALLSENQKKEILLWRQAWLDVTDTMEIPNEPLCLAENIEDQLTLVYPDLEGETFSSMFVGISYPEKNEDEEILKQVNELSDSEETETE